MTVKELIEALSTLHPSMPVRIAYPARDHWHTTLAGEVAGVSVEGVAWSVYHLSDRTEPERGWDKDDDEPTNVALLK